MKTDDLNKAVQEAHRFLGVADTAIRRIKSEEMRSNKFLLGGAKEIGAVKRASMDLTRALADLRHPYRE